jgi:CHASE3 domain sensor protein
MRWSTEKSIALGVILILLILIINVAISYKATNDLIGNERLVIRAHIVLAELESTLSTLRDAETGARGYIITGNEDYLESYKDALRRIDARLDNLKDLLDDNLAQKDNFPLLETTIAARLQDLNDTIALRKANGFDAARDRVDSDIGKREMDQLRIVISLMKKEGNDLLEKRAVESQRSRGKMIFAFSFASLLAFVFVCMTYYLIRAYIAKRRKVAKEREKLIEELRHALSQVKELSGLLPICASCKNIKDDEGYWSQIETYIRDHSAAEFSHSICPTCIEKLYPEFAHIITQKQDKKT